ncbi:hypothetical protein BJY01DRAFT_221549 [Aspergillus pseudoustus]|uniref:Stretch-activated Ca2+-permeable channel component-domain-containing protein n=1 Tax=Aspergillus pseudoustus TaxID=1810923 RepID=A0ABR4JAH8_9EURO
MTADTTIAGTLTAGAKVTFPRYEMYFPQTPEAEEYQRFPTPDPNKEQRVIGPEMRPSLDASVDARAQFDFHITPEAHLGIRVLNPVNKDDTVIDAQIVGFINNTLRFEVQGTVSGGIDDPPAASYSVGIKYLGIGGRAVYATDSPIPTSECSLLTVGTAKRLWDKPREKVLWNYEASTSSSKRSVSEIERPDEEYTPLFSNVSALLDDEWHEITDTLIPRSIDKRSTVADVPAFGNGFDWFDCNDGGQCADGDCADDTCEWNPGQNSLTTRQNGGNTGPPSGVNPAMPCVNTIPAMMYNCKWFPDEVLTGGRVIPGICTNILKGFMMNKSGANGPFRVL